MNSRVRIMDPHTGEARTVTLVYPGEEDSLRGKVSVFTPLGTALLGLPEGARMEWRTPKASSPSINGHGSGLQAIEQFAPLSRSDQQCCSFFKVKRK